MSKKKQIMEMDRKVALLRRLITRVDRSILPDDMKRELKKEIDLNIKKVCKDEYEKTMRTINTYKKTIEDHEKKRIVELSEALDGLRMLYASIKARRTELCEYYDELVKIVRELIRELRRIIRSRIKKEKKKEIERILRLSPESQFEEFKRLIEEAETLEELMYISRVLKRSLIFKQDKYFNYRVVLESMIKRKSAELISGE